MLRSSRPGPWPDTGGEGETTEDEPGVGDGIITPGAGVNLGNDEWGSSASLVITADITTNPRHPALP